MASSRHYVYVGDRRVHYRRAGNGPPLVLLHSGPGSSYSVEAITATLAARHTVIALDNPGYGESEGVGRSQPAIPDYAIALGRTLDALDLGLVDLYGYRTGAKIALDFALTNPDRVRRLLLEGFAHYTPEEKNDMFSYYTPDMTPRWDGTHVISTWSMWRDVTMWWPWFDKTPGARIARALPPADVLHSQVVDFLRAGKDYWQGYHAAFRYPGPSALRKLTVPTLLFATSTDPLRLHMTRLGELPPIITSEVIPAGSNPRQAAADRVFAFLEDSPLADAPPVAPVLWSARQVRRDYVRTSIGELLIRKCGEAGARRPIVLLPSLPSSSITLEPLVQALGQDRPALTIDIPGSGDSAALPGHPAIADVAEVIREALDALGFDDCDLYGTHTGAFIAMDLAGRYPDQFAHLILDLFPLYTPEEAQDRLDNNFPPFVPKTDGTHLLELWFIRRDNMLWSPWYRKTPDHARQSPLPDAEALHLNFMETLKGALTSHAVHEGAFRYPVREALARITVPTLIALAANDEHRERVIDAASAMPRATLADREVAPAEQFRRFLRDE